MMRPTPRILSCSVLSPVVRFVLCCCFFWVSATPALADDLTINAVKLTTFPAAKMLTLAPLLRENDAILVESGSKGELKQLTMATLVAAHPGSVRDALIHPERYPDFVRNITKSSVKQNADGTIDHFYELSYSLLTLQGMHRYVMLPAEAPGATAPVEMFDVHPNSNRVRHYRWEFLPVGGGCMVVLYGYSDSHMPGTMIEQFLTRVPSLEHGLSLVTQLSLLLSMKKRAEQSANPNIAQSFPPPGNVSYEFLLQRGTLILPRTQGGRLSDISMVTASSASPDGLLRVASQVGGWSGFVPSISKSDAATGSDGSTSVDLKQSLPYMSWRTNFNVKTGVGWVDMFGTSGDLQNGRMRWDVRGAANMPSKLVLRLSLAYAQSSMLLRQLYKLEPLFEYGITVGLTLVVFQSVKQQAERTSPAVVAPPPSPAPAPSK